MPSRSKLASALVSVAFAGCVAGAVEAGAAQVGVNVAPTSGNYFTSATVRHAIARLHPAWVRVFIGWNAVEPRPGVYDQGFMRSYATFFAHLPRGTQVDLDIEGTPAWASGSPNIAVPPRDDGAFARFAGHLARAFRGRVRAYEIGDEEDLPTSWDGSVAQYVALLRAGDRAVKAVDRHALVVMGGLAGNDYAYLSAVYRAGGRGAFDAVGVHTDDACNITSPTVFAFNRGTRTVNRWYFLGVASVHRVMAAHGDARKPILMTEIGWSSTSAECQTGRWAGQKRAGVSATVQAAFLRQAYRCLAQPRYRYVRAALWFGLFDGGTSPNPLDNYGLLTAGLRPKPAFQAFRTAARRGGRLAGGC